MDHDTTIEAIELAALEPGGLDRLMAGDTETSRAVAAHLAGCGSCSALLVEVHRDALVIADVVATTPPEDLRARTLAAVRRDGVPRGTTWRPCRIRSRSAWRGAAPLMAPAAAAQVAVDAARPRPRRPRDASRGVAPVGRLDRGGRCCCRSA